MAKLDVENTRNALQNFDFKRLFVEELGWSNQADTRSIPQTVKETAFTRTTIAELSGAVVLEITTPDGVIPDRGVREIIAREIQKLYFEHVLIFVNRERSKSLWFWMKRQAGKTIPRQHEFIKGQPGDLFISKISALVFDISEFDDEGNVPIVEVASRLRRALDIERVTKQFFRDYQQEYFRFCDVIQGIDDERDKQWYASVILNRLMFIYFLQRKLFLDNGNEQYLSAKLAQCQQQFGGDHYYGRFLKPLFFEGFGKAEHDRSPDIRQLLGRIVYLNGGLFLPHRIEDRYPGISIPDSAFGQLFDLFNSYSWTLDDTPGGKDNEINPNVLGYIFEKYINQKEFGAYYTRTEITEYLCEQTVYKLILDAVSERVHVESMSDLLLKMNEDVCKTLIRTLPTLSLLDPACGSGAFLVAAMKTLIRVYTVVIGTAQMSGDPELSGWIKTIQADHPSLLYYIKKQIITNNLYGVDIMEEATEIARLRLFLALVASVRRVEDLEPLPNIDFNILSGNSLIGLMRVADVDFEQHYAQGDLFVKRRSYREILQEKNESIRKYKEHSFQRGVKEGVEQENRLLYLRDHVQDVNKKSNEALNLLLQDEFKRLKIQFEQTSPPQSPSPKKGEGEAKGKVKKRAVTLNDIAALKPFHWAYHFDVIMEERGGFDAIITNPPWEIFKPNAKEFFAQFSDAISKKNMTIKEFKKEQAKLLKDEHILSAWLEYQSGYPHVSAYFRSAPQYENQIAVINGKKAGTDINYYKLFVEQCYNLLKPGGYCGIIIPSGIYTDLGTKQLREMLFSSTRVNQLLGISNEKFIFESVHHAFKLCLLSFEKSGSTQQFKAAFRINPREAVRPEELEFFLHNDSEHVTISISLIRQLSPDSISVIEFKDAKDILILEKISRFPLLGEEIEDTWNLRLFREFDMTNDSHLFQTQREKNALLLYEGKMIWQFTHLFAEARYWIDEQEGRKSILKRGEKDEGQTLDYQSYRLGFRDVAASTNERTMIAAIIPRNVFAGNTLIVSKPFAQITELLCCSSLLNSYICDYVVRQKVTSHCNMFYVYQLPIPRLDVTDSVFNDIVERTAKLVCTTDEFADLWNEVMETPWTPECGAPDETERNQLRAELDGMIAIIYGLTYEEFEYILTTFPLVPQTQKDAALQCFQTFKTQADQHTAESQHWKTLIAQGESNTLEFKSTLRYCLREKSPQKYVEHATMKTLAAYLNSTGGTLLIGVDDSGAILGLDNDFSTFSHKKPDKVDEFLKHFDNLIANNFGDHIHHYLDIQIATVEGKSVCAVTIQEKASDAVWLTNKEKNTEQFYIRRSASTIELSPREAMQYIRDHWK